MIQSANVWPTSRAPIIELCIDYTIVGDTPDYVDTNLTANATAAACDVASGVFVTTTDGESSFHIKTTSLDFATFTKVFVEAKGVTQNTSAGKLVIYVSEAASPGSVTVISAGALTGYDMIMGSGTTASVNRVKAGTRTEIATPLFTAYSATDCKLEVEVFPAYNIIRIYKDGVQVGSDLIDADPERPVAFRTAGKGMRNFTQATQMTIFCAGATMAKIGAFAWSKYLLLTIDPEVDAIYKTDAETTPVVATGDDVIRAYPGLTPEAGDYFKDTDATDYATWRESPDGILLRNAIRFVDGADFLDTVTMVLNQVIGTTNGCLVLAGKIITPPTSGGSQGRQLFGDIGGASMLIGCTNTGGATILGNWVNSSPTIYQVTGVVGTTNPFTVVVRKRGTIVDMWLNGKKLTGSATTGAINAVNIDTEKLILSGGVNTGSTACEWDMTFAGAGSGKALEDVHCQTMADQLNLLVGLPSPPARSVIASEGFGGSGNIFATHFDDAYGGDGYWNQASVGTVITEGSGVCSIPAGAAREYMGCVDFEADPHFPSPADAGVLLIDYVDSDDATVIFQASTMRRNTNRAIVLELASGAKPKVKHLTTASIAGYGEDSSTEFTAAEVLSETAKCYLLRSIEVAGGGGGFTCELWVGDWDTDLATTLRTLTLVQSVDLFTAATRTTRDAAAATTNHIERRSGGSSSGNPSTMSGIVWLDFDP